MDCLIFIMSKLQSKTFDLTRFSHQGAYFSSYTPLRVEEYLRSPFLPSRSAYHLISCIHPAIMARSNVQFVLATYINASQVSGSKVIIDLCLPYYDAFSNRTFMGRYIIFRGELIGVRLSTNAKGFGPQFSAWPRHKANTITVKSGSKPYNIMVGEIAIYLSNIRIGLLFESQLQTSAQEYINCGFEMIALTYEGNRQGELLVGLKQDLSRFVLLLEGGVGGEFEQEAKEMMAGKEYECKKSKVYISYYSFENFYAKKQTLFLSEKEKNCITPIQIDIALMQPKENLTPCSSLYYELILTPYSHLSYCPSSSLSKYLHRLSILHKRSGGKKITIMLEDTPEIICFLYLLEVILKEYENEQLLPLRNIFKFIDLSNTHLASILPRYTQLKFQTGRTSQHQRDITTKLIKTLDFLTDSEASQCFFPIIVSHQQTINILQMLNQRQRLRLQEGEIDTFMNHNMKPNKYIGEEGISQVLPNCKTWIATSFFDEEELKQMYFSEGLRDVVADNGWHQDVWKRHERLGKRKETSEQRQVEAIEEMCLAEYVSTDNFLQKNCPFINQFQSHYSKIKEKGNFSRKLTFAHFFFRRLTYIKLEQIPSILQELLSTSEASLLSTYRFLHSRPVLLSHRLTSRLTLNTLALARQEAQHKFLCRSCKVSFLPELMYNCRVCNEKFCYECLMKSGAYSQNNLVRQGATLSWIKMCLVCLGIFIDKQNDEEQELEGNINQKNQEECHYCGRSLGIRQYKCKSPDCHRCFCRKCIEEQYKPIKKEYEKDGWFCFVCQHKCYCNSCQDEKRRLMIIEKKKDSHKQLAPHKKYALNNREKSKEDSIREKSGCMESEASETRITRQSPRHHRNPANRLGCQTKPIQL